MIELWVQPAGPETISEGLGSPMLRVPSRRIGKARQVTLCVDLRLAKQRWVATSSARVDESGTADLLYQQPVNRKRASGQQQVWLGCNCPSAFPGRKAMQTPDASTERLSRLL